MALGIAVAAVVALGTAGCGSSSSSGGSTSSGATDSTAAPTASTASTASAAPAKKTDITFSLDFLVDGLHAPFYVAQEQGLYDKGNVNVSIKPSTGSSDSVARVASGRAQIGLADAPVALTAVAKGLPIKIIGVLLVHNANSTEVLTKSGITDLAGLKGKTMGVSPGGSERDLVNALLKMNNVDPGSVKKVSVQPQNAKANLLSGQVDAINFFPDIFADVSDKITFFPWYKLGIDPYGTVIIANKDFLDQNPDAVKAFMNASYQGLNSTFQDPAAAAATVTKAAKGDPKFFANELKILQPYWYDKALQPDGLGSMTDDRWKTTQDIALKYLGQPKAVPLTDVYTNDYLGDPVTPDAAPAG